MLENELRDVCESEELVEVEVVFEALPDAAEVAVELEALWVEVDVRVAFEVLVELAVEMPPAAVDVELEAAFWKEK